MYVPSPATSALTSYSTHAFVPSAPLLSTAPLTSAGRVFQVMPVSVQLFPAAYTAGPLFVPLVVANTRNLALCTGPVTPLTVKRR